MEIGLLRAVSSLKNNRHRWSFFSDEVHFELNGSINKQNIGYWSNWNPHQTVTKSLHSECVTVRALSQMRIIRSFFSPWQTHNLPWLPLALFLSKVGWNSNEVRMCYDWFRIDFFRLNLHFIIEILVHICWGSEFIIVSLCWEITQLIISNFVLPLIRTVYIFKSAMLARPARHCSDKSQYASLMPTCDKKISIMELVYIINQWAFDCRVGGPHISIL